MAKLYGIDVGAGVVDPDFKGNVGIVLFNHSNKEYKGLFPRFFLFNHLYFSSFPFKIFHFPDLHHYKWPINSSDLVNEGDRVAQLICEKIEFPKLMEVKEFCKAVRQDAGFGASGK